MARKILCNTAFQPVALVAVCLLLFTFAANAYSYDFAGGIGQPNDPYQIATAQQLLSIGSDPNLLDKCFILINDIDLDPNIPCNKIFDKAPIAYDSSQASGYQYPFKGIFDGNGLTIYNFTCISNEKYFIGFFGYIDSIKAKITNLTLIDANIICTNTDYSGILTGYLRQGEVENCHIINGKIKALNFTGGIAGFNQEGLINKSSCFCDIIGKDYCGGIVGENDSIISGCHSNVSVTGRNSCGGISGCSGMIINCYAEGVVQAINRVGGLVGVNTKGIINSYSTALVFGSINYGGLCGLDGAAVISSYWDVNTSNIEFSDGGSPKTTEQMFCMSTFRGWGCESTWTINDGNDYPRLYWEKANGALIRNEAFYHSGSGKPSDPYLICTPEQLNYIADVYCDYDKHFKLISDINLEDYNENNFNIIGKMDCEVPVFPFSGVFDGNDHVISNFSYSTPIDEYGPGGLFGFVAGPNALIKNVRMDNADVNCPTGINVGSLVGALGAIYTEDPNFMKGKIENCTILNSRVTGLDQVGGLAGFSMYGEISKCSVSTNINARYYVGGIVGHIVEGYIDECSSYCGIYPHNLYYADGSIGVGGVAGLIEGGKISNSYSNSYIDMWNEGGEIGGLVGSMTSWETTPQIVNSHSKGLVNGFWSIGGLVGSGGNVFNCSANSVVYGDNPVGGLLGEGYNCYYCYSNCIVNGSAGVGGLIGAVETDEGEIQSCYSTGYVTGGSEIGGLIGMNFSPVKNCYSLSSVKGYDMVGGFIGQNNSIEIINCYTANTVDANLTGASFIADAYIHTNYIGCFWDVNTSNVNDGVGNIDPDPNGVYGRTTAQMQTLTTFTDYSWDFNDVWAICEGTNYPRLQWQIPIADLLCPDGVNFRDFAYFSYRWLNTDCGDSNDCDYTDFDLSGTVDANDLKIFTNQWLQ